MTGQLRLRQLHPLPGARGARTLVYDLERTFVLEVPKRLRRRLSAELPTQRFSPDLAGWLRDEDLLTAHRRPSPGDRRRLLPVLTDLSLDLSGACNMECVYCFEGALGSRLGPMDEDTMKASLEFFFRKCADARSIVLHFGSGEPLLRFGMLRKLVAEAGRGAASSGKRVSYELTTNATLVTPEIAAFLHDHPFNVRVSCDGPARIHDRVRPLHGGRPSYGAVERGLRLLLHSLPERVTVNSVISHPTRLAEVWAWAKAMGLRHYHVIKVGALPGRDLNLDPAEVAQFREDLGAICDDLHRDVQAGRAPMDFQPITKVVRRLMIPQPVARFCGVAGSYLGVASDGEVYPCFRHLGVERYRLGDVRGGVDDERRREFLAAEAAVVDRRPICKRCWARYLCGGGCCADSTVYGPDERKPQTHHCPFWKAEIEAGIRFYDRLRATDPAACLRFFRPGLAAAPKA